jgi:hypothetical protein
MQGDTVPPFHALVFFEEGALPLSCASKHRPIPDREERLYEHIRRWKRWTVRGLAASEKQAVLAAFTAKSSGKQYHGTDHLDFAS